MALIILKTKTPEKAGEGYQLFSRLNERLVMLKSIENVAS